MRAYIELLINIHLGTSFNLQRNYITATVICNISLGISEQTRNIKKKYETRLEYKSNVYSEDCIIRTNMSTLLNFTKRLCTITTNRREMWSKLFFLILLEFVCSLSHLKFWRQIIEQFADSFLSANLRNTST